MTQPGHGEDAGQLDLSVVADLRGFAARLRREVNAAAAKVRARVGVDVRSAGLRTELRKAVKEAGDKAKVTARVGVNIPVRDFRRAVREVAEKAKARARIGVSIAATQMRRAVKEAGDKAAAKVRVDADTKPAQRAIAALKDQRVKLGVDTKHFLGKVRTAASAAVGLLGVVAKGAGFAVLAAGAASAGGNLLAFAGAAATAVQSAGLLPAVIGAAVGIFAAFKIALSGVGDAISETFAAYSTLAAGGKLTAAQQEKLNESLAKLSPSARQFVLELSKLAPALNALRLHVQEKFFVGLGTAVRGLADRFLPALKTGLGEVAGQIRAGLLDSITRLNTEANKASVSTILRNTAEAARDLFAALGPIGEALLRIAEVGSNFLPGLSSGIGEAAKQFAAFIEAAAQDGRLHQWISDGLSMLGQLAKLGKDVFGIIRGILGAASDAAGGGAVTVLGQLVGALNEAVNSAGGQQALVQFFTALNQIGSALSPVLSAVLSGLAPLARIVADLAVALSPGLTVLVRALADGLALLAPAAGPVGEALSAVASALAPLLPLIGAQLANVLTLVAGALQVIAAEAGPLIELFAGMATEVTQALLPVLQQLVAGALGPAVEIGLALARAFAPLVPVIVQLAQTIASQLMAHLPALQALLAGQLVPAITQVAETLGAALLDALLAIAPHIPALVDVGLQLAGVFVELLVALIPLLPSLVDLWAAGVKLFEAVLPLLPQILSLVVLFLRLAIAASPLIPLVTKIVDRVTGFIDKAIALAGWIGRLAKAIGEGLKDALSEAGQFVQKVVDKFGSFKDKVKEVGRDLVRGFIDGIKEWGGRAVDAAKGVVGDAISGAKKLLGISSPSRVFMAIGRQVVEGYTIGMDRSRPAAARAADRLASATVDPFNAPAPGRDGTDGADGAAAAGSPLIGQVVLGAAGGSFGEQLDELMFRLRVIRRGGVVADG